MTVDQGRINDTYVSSLRFAIKEGEVGLHGVPTLVKRIIQEDAWQERIVEKTGSVARFSRFVDFVQAKPMDGLGTDLATIKRLCSDDMGAVDLIDRVTQLPAHRPVTVDNVHSSEVRPDGNSRDAALRRLRKDRPDLHERVIGGELSPHAAMLEAGFRKTPTALEKLNRAWDVASPEERAAFLARIAHEGSS
jgi:hypothetical protein